MTLLLDHAFAEAAKLPPYEQDMLAAQVLEEIKSEREWQSSFAESQNVLEELVKEALEEHYRNKTRELSSSID